MKKISPREKNLLMILGGVFILVILYMYLFTPLQNKVNAMKQEIENVQWQIQDLEWHRENVDYYLEMTDAYKANIENKLTSLPADVKEEDLLAYLFYLENATGMDISAVSFEEATEYARFYGAPGNPIYAGGLENMQLLRKEAVVSANLSYDALKNTIYYIYNSPLLTTLDSISISYNSSTGSLNSSLNLSRYFINYQEAEYTPEDLPAVSIGVDSLFG